MSVFLFALMFLLLSILSLIAASVAPTDVFRSLIGISMIFAVCSCLTLYFQK